MKKSRKELMQRLLVSFFIVLPNIVISYLTRINNAFILNLYERNLMSYVDAGVIIWILVCVFIGFKIEKSRR